MRVYEGEVEHFVAAQTEGIGIRVDPRRPHRLRLRRHARRGRRRRGAGRGARQRRVRHRPTSGPGWPSPTASPSIDQELWSDALADVPDRAQDRAGQGARAADARPPTRGSASTTPTTPTSLGESAVATTTGIRRSGPGERLLRRRQHAGRRRRRDPDRLRLQRRPLARRVRPRQGGRARPPTGPPACSARRSRRRKRLTVVLDPYVTAQFLGIIVRTLNGESVVKGRSLFADRLGESVATAARHAGRRPDQPAGLHRHRRRRRGPRRPPQRAHRRRRAAAVRAQLVLAPAGPARASTGNAVRGGFKGTPGVGCLALQLAAGHARSGRR